MRFTSFALGLVLACAPCVVGASEGAAQAKPKPLSAEQIKQLLIAESIASYSGSCPCPYSTASNGSRCGRRSAYSREGGAEVLCYSKDVTDAMVQQYRDEHAQD